MQFSDRYGESLTEFQQKVANFSQKRLWVFLTMGVSISKFCIFETQFFDNVEEDFAAIF